MKTFKTVTKLALVALTVIISSCSKDDPAPTPTPTPAPISGSYVTAKVDGADFSSLIFGVSTAVASRTGTGPNALILVMGSDLSANTISISLIDLNIIAGQTYAITPSLDGSVLGYLNASTSTSWDTGNCDGSIGSITISAYDNTKIEGTFTFTAKESETCSGVAKSVTNGSFRGVFPQ